MCDVRRRAGRRSAAVHVSEARTDRIQIRIPPFRLLHVGTTGAGGAAQGGATQPTRRFGLHKFVKAQGPSFVTRRFGLHEFVKAQVPSFVKAQRRRGPLDRRSGEARRRWHARGGARSGGRRSGRRSGRRDRGALARRQGLRGGFHLRVLNRPRERHTRRIGDEVRQFRLKDALRMRGGHDGRVVDDRILVRCERRPGLRFALEQHGLARRYRRDPTGRVHGRRRRRRRRRGRRARLLAQQGGEKAQVTLGIHQRIARLTVQQRLRLERLERRVERAQLGPELVQDRGHRRRRVELLQADALALGAVNVPMVQRGRRPLEVALDAEHSRLDSLRREPLCAVVAHVPSLPPCVVVSVSLEGRRRGRGAGPRLGERHLHQGMMLLLVGQVLCMHLDAHLLLQKCIAERGAMG